MLLSGVTLLTSCVTKSPDKPENTRVFVYNISNNKFELPKGRKLDSPQLIEYDITNTGWHKYTDESALEILNTYKRVK